jgi:hypothetical protein
MGNSIAATASETQSEGSAFTLNPLREIKKIYVTAMPKYMPVQREHTGRKWPPTMSVRDGRQWQTA